MTKTEMHVDHAQERPDEAGRERAEVAGARRVGGLQAGPDRSTARRYGFVFMVASSVTTIVLLGVLWLAVRHLF
jgi:hypothetical protein